MSVLVTAQESELLRVARAAVGLSSYAEVERLLGGQRTAPNDLGPTAMELLQETLSRGIGLAVNTLMALRASGRFNVMMAT